jgi:hypothetical protein
MDILVRAYFKPTYNRDGVATGIIVGSRSELRV